MSAEKKACEGLSASAIIPKQCTMDKPCAYRSRHVSRTVSHHPWHAEGVHVLQARSSQDRVTHVRGSMASQRVHGLRPQTANCPPETRSAERDVSSRSAGLMTPQLPR